jgi:hypothetical protein
MRAWEVWIELRAFITSMSKTVNAQFRFLSTLVEKIADSGKIYVPLE